LVEALSDEQIEAIFELGRMLGEPENRAYHGRIVRELGIPKTRRILSEVVARAETDPRTHKGKLFTHLAEQQRHRRHPLSRLH
jgi:hypothetical protein